MSSPQGTGLVESSDLIVGPAAPADLLEAEAVMREVLRTDLGGYREQWHRDLDDLEAAYLRRPGCVLLVARDVAGVVGTAAVKPCVLTSPPNPEWLAREYNRPEVCQLVRVWVARRARRRGVGRALAGRAVAWSAGPGGYRRVYLHTDAGVPGAEAFWRSMPTREIHDARPDPFHTVHFEIDVDAVLRAPGC
ncbi:N-acetyltransferase [Actinoplanes sp. NBRC 14428]|uniref:Acetyltransferase (GNAT) family protein n=1 Tax=Pseudosporangium ferrugineum TaxID=439699 RepID=A0A2T0SBS8_9ACTN|nr:GNAT family N-acetyltransferase [Pseudosporangium ferrugineum]PRY30878.1 acetyltransferase (GNAT) family protein [Pseudosporangium ferrugineum]BCJ50392.1 N-acetyltransferase [Actinoplanes sp. NBRC 14428]